MLDSCIQPSYSLASLPRPLDGETGRTLAAPVYGFRAGTKRKRHEIAVGVDGESVNIYNIQNQTLTTTYAIPPTFRLCVAPLSLYVRTQSQRGARRETYVLISETQGLSRKRLRCVTEDIIEAREESQSQGIGLSNAQIKDVEVPVEGTVVSLDAVDAVAQSITGIKISEHKSSSIVIATFSNGDIWSYDTQSGNNWHECETRTSEPEAFEVKYSALISVEAARGGIFKTREDVLATIQAAPTTNSSQLLCQVVHTASTAHLRVYSLDVASPISLQSTGIRLRLLNMVDLPAPRKSKMKLARYDIHASSGKLYRLSDGKLVVLDASTTIPTRSVELGSKREPIIGFIRTSSSTILGISTDNASLYETSYGSVLSVASLPPNPGSNDATKKRKWNRDDLSAVPLLPIASFADEGLVIGVSQHELRAIPITKDLKRARLQKTLLVDVLNRGGNLDRKVFDKNEQRALEWKEWKATIDRLANDGDASGLESLVMDDTRLGLQGTARFEDPAAADPFRQYLHASGSAINVDRRKILYLLRKFFVLTDDPISRLQIRLGSPQIIAWLASMGFLSTTNLMLALNTTSLQPGVVFIAVSRFDEGFQLMRQLLELPFQWDLEEVVMALKLLLQSFRAPSQDDTRRTLLNASEPGNDVEMVNGDAEAQILREAEAAEQELDRTTAFCDNGVELRGDIFTSILARLRIFPDSKVTKKMRSTLTHEDLVFFIELMRLELANGGWTSRYVGTEDDEHDEAILPTNGDDIGPSDQAIKAIGNLLTCAVDAIGTNGWLVGLSGREQHAVDLVERLRAEVSAGLEGCYEATIMEELLTTMAENKEKIMNRGEPDASNALLPLGRRIETSDLSSSGRDGKAKKSKMVLARERSQAVGKYSIDRIRF